MRGRGSGCHRTLKGFRSDRSPAREGSPELQGGRHHTPSTRLTLESLCSPVLAAKQPHSSPTGSPYRMPCVWLPRQRKVTPTGNLEGRVRRMRSRHQQARQNAGEDVIRAHGTSVSRSCTKRATSRARRTRRDDGRATGAVTGACGAGSSTSTLFMDAPLSSGTREPAGLPEGCRIASAQNLVERDDEYKRKRLAAATSLPGRLLTDDRLS
jgi:hypothetical protein